MNPDFNIPPSAPDVENAVLGALILEELAWDRVSSTLLPEMFYTRENQIVFSTISEMKKNQRAVDLRTLTIALKDQGKLEEIGGPVFIASLTRGVASAAHLEHHAFILTEKYVKRLILSTTFKMQEQVYSDSAVDGITQLWEETDLIIGKIAIGGEQTTDMNRAIVQSLEILEKENVLKKKGLLAGISSGIQKLDNTIGGFRPGTLNVLGARPGVGKTSLALWMGTQAAVLGRKVLFLSYEMLIRDLVMILMAGTGNLDRIRLRDADIDDDYWKEIHRSVTKIVGLPIRWVENPALSAQQLAAIIKYEKRKRGLDLVIVDYLQLIRPMTKTYNREQEISTISRELKKAALTEQIAIIALSQLNREAEEKEPKLSHLRESGALEQDADVVILPFRPVDYGIDAAPNLLKLKVEKNRRGLLTQIDLYHNHQMTDFSESNYFQPINNFTKQTYNNRESVF